HGASKQVRDRVRRGRYDGPDVSELRAQHALWRVEVKDGESRHPGALQPLRQAGGGALVVQEHGAVVAVERQGVAEAGHLDLERLHDGQVLLVAYAAFLLDVDFDD